MTIEEGHQPDNERLGPYWVSTVPRFVRILKILPWMDVQGQWYYHSMPLNCDSLLRLTPLHHGSEETIGAMQVRPQLQIRPLHIQTWAAVPGNGWGIQQLEVGIGL